MQGSVELGGVAPSPVSAGVTEVKAEPVNTQVNERGAAAAVHCSTVRESEMIGAIMNS